MEPLIYDLSSPGRVGAVLPESDVPHTPLPEGLLRAALPLPTSCLYSLSDGVVPPQEATIDGDPALHENIRVAGSHTGMGFNAMVMWIVADRLAQPEGQWRPFKPEGLNGSLYRMLAGEPVSA
jgi:hypothetical protein